MFVQGYFDLTGLQITVFLLYADNDSVIIMSVYILASYTIK